MNQQKYIVTISILLNLHLPSRSPRFFPLKGRREKTLRDHEEPHGSDWLRREHSNQYIHLIIETETRILTGKIQNDSKNKISLLFK